MLGLLTVEKSNALDFWCLINFEEAIHLMITIVVPWWEIVQSVLCIRRNIVRVRISKANLVYSHTHINDKAEDFENLEIS